MAMKRRIAAQIAQLNKQQDAHQLGLRAPLLPSISIQTGSGQERPVSSSSKAMPDPPSPTSPAEPADDAQQQQQAHDEKDREKERENEDFEQKQQQQQQQQQPSRLKRTISHAAKLAPVPLGVKLRWDREISRKTLFINLNAWLGIALMIFSLQAGWDADLRVCRCVSLFCVGFLVCLLCDCGSAHVSLTASLPFSAYLLRFHVN